MKKIIIAAIFIISFTSICFSAERNNCDSLGDREQNLINKAFNEINLNKNDVYIPNDVIDIDKHRLEIVNKLFDSPISSFNSAAFYADLIKDEDEAKLFHRILQELKLSNHNKIRFDNVLPKTYLETKYELEDLNKSNFVTNSILIKYLSAWTALSEALDKDLIYVNLEQVDFLMENVINITSNKSNNEEMKDVFELDRITNEELNLSEELCKKASVIQYYKLYALAFSYYNSLLAINKEIEKNFDIYRDSIKTCIYETELGKIAIGGAGDDYYSGEFLLIIDIGGNDHYNIKLKNKKRRLLRPVQTIIDFSGNDNYSGDDYCLASGFFAVDILIDKSGDDTYSAGNYSLGSGVFGVGILKDYSGNDTYKSKSLAQGSGAFGIGLLIDKSGNDQYISNGYSQGFAYVRAFGLLADHNGNDTYITSNMFEDFLRYEDHYIAFTQGASLGIRDVASGGIGLLYDYDGNDSYSSDIFAQGTSYWGGYAVLYDKAGHDTYKAYQYSQGSAVHFGNAILWDRKGDDIYLSHGVSQGCGHDWATGLFLDEFGKDHYFAESLSQGGSSANGFALFIDSRDKDSYVGLRDWHTQGYGDFRRNLGGYGLFIEGEGKDQYSSIQRNELSEVKSHIGLFLDLEIESEESIAEKKNKEEKFPELSNDLEKLFIQSKAASQRHQYMVGPAREKIATMGNKAKNFLMQKFSSKRSRAKHALLSILIKMNEIHPDIVKELVLENLKSDDKNSILLAIRASGRCQIEEAITELHNHLKSENWIIRSSAVNTIGDMNNPEFANDLTMNLKDKKHFVRAQAAYAFCKLRPENWQTKFEFLLKDEYPLVRKNAIKGILISENKDFEYIKDVLSLDAKADIIKDFLLCLNDLTKDDLSLSEMKKLIKTLRSDKKAILKDVIESIENDYWRRNLKIK